MIACRIGTGRWSDEKPFLRDCMTVGQSVSQSVAVVLRASLLRLVLCDTMTLVGQLASTLPGTSTTTAPIDGA